MLTLGAGLHSFYGGVVLGKYLFNCARKYLNIFFYAFLFVYVCTICICQPLCDETDRLFEYNRISFAQHKIKQY